MKNFFLTLSLFYFFSLACQTQNSEKTQPISLFDGQTFNGWEGDTLNTWRIENGELIGGSLTETVPHNEFLCITKTYNDFILNLEIKLTGDEGFINSGIQFRSIRLDEPPYEMRGYQADFGENYWAGLYDESRRDSTLTAPDSAQVLDWIKINDWNEYRVHAEGRRIRLYVNGHQTVDYTEADDSIPQKGLIGLQIHGGGKAEAAFKDITIQEIH
ncbi:DUF1080 domain-containing protein [Jiulongibacter sediminis]|uniref:3-keto-disaccharide hydrolase n=1 Tax=Jiulongibacter sediminis TaxID=1605367 RepID=UPI0026ED2E0E|nr:DUF1080 domain-containing protein [Jiulongibacter sediminis]